MAELTPKGVIVKGYKATDKDIKCRDYKFTVGEWHEHDGDLELCESGFHFCEYPSGPWCYYGDGRLWNVEAELVLKSVGPGAELKHVTKRIRLVSEIEIGGDRNAGHWNNGNGNTGNGNTGNLNTGNRNTGNRNTGNWNTGNGNTGDRNAGHWNNGNGNTGNGNTGNLNTGNRNTGNWNTGNWNTGNWNTGDRNTGNWNTGNRNTGNRNTGNWNTGDGNTGNRNNGDGNCGDYHSGMFCHGEAPFFMFNQPAKRDDVDQYTAYRLSDKLTKDDDFNYSEFLTLPNASIEAIKELHEAHKKARADKK